MEDMGMTDGQWKDFLRIYKDDLEEFEEYEENNDKQAFKKKISKMLKRIQEGIEN